MQTVESGHVDRRNWLVLFSLVASCDLLDTVHTYLGNHFGAARPASFFHTAWQCAVFWFLYSSFVPIIVHFLRAFPLEVRKPRNLLLHGIAALLFTYIHTAILVLIFDRRHNFRIPQFFRLLEFDFALVYLLYWGIAGVAYALAHAEERKRRQLADIQLAANFTQARLEALQAQLNPHFFFNTLQAISTLALAGEREAVVKTLGCLSDLIRVSFDQRRPKKVSLASELEFVSRYVAIQKIVVGERLSVRHKIEPETLNALVPAMVLQPLVENAIMHGVAAKPGPGTVTLQAVRENETLRLEVADSGPGFASIGAPGKGVGFSAAEARLRLLYGPGQRFEVVRSLDGGAAVRVSVPLEYCVTGAHETTAGDEYDPHAGRG